MCNVRQMGYRSSKYPLLFYRPMNQILLRTTAAVTDSEHGDVSKSFRTGRFERELQMVQLSATGCSCIVIL